MSSDLTGGLVRVMAANGDTAGSGFVVTKSGLIATCAHVVEGADGGPGTRVSVCFQMSGSQATATVAKEFWRPSNAQDIAILRCDTPLPPGISPLPLGPSSGCYGHEFQSVGFPEVKKNEGLGAKGTIGVETKEVGFPVIQLMNSSDLTNGFSGAPVFDRVAQRVIGMVSGITAPDQYHRLDQTAFMIPTEELKKICTELEVSDVCPYRGLESFTEADSAYYFGRDEAIQDMVRRLANDPSFLAVLGPSGSGKSSLVMAGLIPRLRAGDFADVVFTRPNDWHNAPEESWGAVETRLQACLKGKRVLLLVDQFEELFTVVRSEKRAGVVSQLARVLKEMPGCTLVLIMRDDFYGRLSPEAPELLPRFERSTKNVPASIQPSDLERIVLGPAEAVGLSFEDGLAARVVEDAIEAAPAPAEAVRTARSTVLPLMEFTLTQLWEKRRDRVLTHEVYDAMGRVLGGVTQWANRAYDGLEDAAKPLARNVCVKLVHLGDEARGLPDTRRRRRLSELRE